MLFSIHLLLKPRLVHYDFIKYQRKIMIQNYSSLSLLVLTAVTVPVISVLPVKAAHLHCRLIPYNLVPGGQVNVNPNVKVDKNEPGEEFSIKVPVNSAAPSETDCPGGKIGVYEISDLAGLSLSLGFAGSPPVIRGDVIIGENEFKDLLFLGFNQFNPFTIPRHLQPKAIEFNFIDDEEDFVNVTFKNLIGVGILENETVDILRVSFKDINGDHYYQTFEPSSILSLIIGGIVLGASKKKQG